MSRTASPAFLGTEFDNFLFAPIGEDGNGMLLSVLSALARLELDPWQEAARLARLPATSATRRLASLLAALPDGARGQRDFSAIAARLVALLPRKAPSSAVTLKRPTSVVRAPSLRAVMWVIVAFLIFALAAILTR